MAYKTLLTVLTDDRLAGLTLTHATALAETCDAHLDVLCLGVDRSQAGYYYAGASAMIVQDSISHATEEAEALAAFSCKHLDGRDGRWGVDTGVTQLADITRHVAARARFSDLVVVPRPYGDNCGAELELVVEGALFEGQTPVLVVPDVSLPVPKPKRIVLAWNESAEALNAVRASLPLLQSADIVHVVVIDPPKRGPNRSDPGGMLSQYLSRHGARAQIDVLSKTMPLVSDVLLRHIRDIDADMVVMGAYGHSRFREAILGGATRNMLENCPVPVFMAH